MAKSVDKGKRGERELAEHLRVLLSLDGVDDYLQRGQQGNGGHTASDITGLRGWWIECKRVERPSFGQWLDKLMSDVVKARSKCRPLLCWRRNRGFWWAVLRLDDWAALVRDREALQRENIELRRAVGLPPREQPQHEPRQVTLDEVT